VSRPWSEPDAAALARAAERVCDRYAEAHEVALRVAAEGLDPSGAAHRVRVVRAELLGALTAVSDAIEPGHGRWGARALLANAGIVDADAWAGELLALAQGVEDEARTTEPGAEPGESLDAATTADRDVDEAAQDDRDALTWDARVDEMAARVLAGEEPV
jgi:hypothetical protein